MTPIDSQDLGFGITCIDTAYSRPGLAACYLIEQDGKAAFIDTGTYYTVPLLLKQLEKQGLTSKDVQYVIPTHVHLDHAGGAGELMRHCPNAKLVIHPRGATHMIDPARLKAGATAVYGEEAFKAQLGDLIPVEESRVMSAPDQTKIDLNGRELLILDTPGHASHHFCLYDAISEGIFTGDTFGVAYPELAAESGPYIFPPTTPVQFNPEDWVASVDRLLSLDPKRMYLTHYGMVTDVDTLAETLMRRIVEFANLARQYREADEPTAGLKLALTERMIRDVQSAGNPLADDEIQRLLAMDIDLNAQGLSVWLERIS